MMKRIFISILAVVLIVVTGCGRAKPWVQAGAESIDVPGDKLTRELSTGAEGTQNRWTGHITAYAAIRPPIPNARLQPPAVSPGARWIAYLAPSDSGEHAGSDGLITGKGLSGVSLWVRALDRATDPRPVALSGACWPSWSTDGRVLAFVTFDQGRRSTLGLYHVQTGEVQRKAVGLRCVLMPAFNPSGTRIAVSAYGEVPDQALIFIIDPKIDQAQPGPPAGDGAQLLPRWVDDQTLLFLELAKDAVRLKRWTIGDNNSSVIAELPGPDSIFDAQHMFAGIADPLRPDIGAYTYYNLAEDRIEVLDLATLGTRVLPRGFRGGAWWGDDWLVASSDDRVELVSSRRTNPGTDHPRMIRLFTGRWLPIWADRDQKAIVLMGENEEPDMFSLMQIWLVADDD